MIQRIASIWILLCGNTVRRVGKNSTQELGVATPPFKWSPAHSS
jgi:hypothetical protein